MYTPNLYLASGLSEVVSPLTMFERDSSKMNICLPLMQNFIFIQANVLFNGELFKWTPLITFFAPLPGDDQKLNGPLLT